MDVYHYERFNLSKFNTDNVVDMNNIFLDCASFK